MGVPYFVYSFKIDEHLDCSYVFAIMSSAEMNIFIQVFVPMFSSAVNKNTNFTAHLYGRRH